MLQKLQEKGKLTDQEFPENNATPFRKMEAPSGTHAEKGLITWRIKFLLLVSLVLVGFSWFKTRTRLSTQSLTTIHKPVILIDEVDHLPSPAWKTIRLALPYDGIVNINIQVVGGNPIDVLLTRPDQFDNLIQREWINLRVYEDFNASKTTAYRRAAKLAKGSYYLLVRDISVGTPSSLSSDISVKVQLNP